MASLRTLLLTLCLALPVLLMAEPALRPVKVVLFPVREAEIVSRIDGTVRNCILKMGDAFKKGDLIMQIDDARHRIELARAKAREQDVRIQAQFARETYLSYKKLFEEQIQSHNELARRKAEADSLQARMLISAADVSEAQLMLGYCVFKAPFAGRLEQMLCREHETVRAGQPVFRIILLPAYSLHGILYFSRVNSNLRPPSGRLEAVMLPPWNITACFTIASPRPVPPLLRERPLSTR